MNKLVCLFAVSLALVACVESGPVKEKRSVIYTSAAVPVVHTVAAVPAVHTVAAVPAVAAVRTAVVQHHPTTVVKTEQVHSGNHASYSYSSEVHNSQPTVVQQTVAAAPTVVASAPVVSSHVVATAPVATSVVSHVPTIHHAIPAAYGYGVYPYYNGLLSHYGYLLRK